MMTPTEPEQPSAPVDWPLVEARLFAYASDDVLKALDEANEADSEWDAVFHKWIADYEQAQDAQQASNPPEAVEKAFPNAKNMDHTLMVTIRTELQHRPHPTQHANKLWHRDGTRRAH
jgi:hypothetical protein